MARMGIVYYPTGEVAEKRKTRTTNRTNGHELCLHRAAVLNSLFEEISSELIGGYPNHEDCSTIDYLAELA